MKVLTIILLLVIAAVAIAVFYPMLTGRAPGENVSGGSLYKSGDGGESWQNLDSFAGGEVTDLALDGEDKNFLLVGTERRGVWRGGPDGSRWEQFPESLGEGSRVFDILEPASQKFLTALVFFQNRGRVIASARGTRRELLFTPLERFAFIKGFFSGDRIRLIGSDGGFYESLNGGGSWSVLSRFREGLLLFEPNRQNHLEAWAADSRGSLFRSNDGGKNWKNLTSALSDFAQARETRVIFYEPNSGILYHGSRHGLLESPDKGESFRPVALPAPKDALPITAFAVDSANPSKLLAAASNQLYLSTDRGLSWKAVSIPASGSIGSILIDPRNPKNIFIGLKAPERLR